MHTFGTHEGEEVLEVEIVSQYGARAKIITWGAALRDLQVPTSKGPQRVVLGFDELATYVSSSPHCGAIPGRFANRIKHGRIHVGGRDYQLDLNQDGKHHRHGGRKGFGKRVWRVIDTSASAVTLGITSRDGDMGYPGTLEARCTYRFDEPASLVIELSATTDKPTIVNLTNHAYFNLDGDATISNHTLQIDADTILPLDADDIPTGEVRHVKGTPYDFRSAKAVGDHTRYDINYLLENSGALCKAATVRSAKSGLTLECWTTQPGLQFYDGAKLDLAAKGIKGLDGRAYGPRAGLCLEPQHFPDTPHHSQWPSVVLTPGQTFSERIEYRFS
jgi:aldose 1-epimerase